MHYSYVNFKIKLELSVEFACQLWSLRHLWASVQGAFRKIICRSKGVHCPARAPCMASYLKKSLKLTVKFWN
jgi:hypothetical protein